WRDRGVAGAPVGSSEVGIHWVCVAMHCDDPDRVATRPWVDRCRHCHHRREPAWQGAGGETGHVTTIADSGDHDADRNPRSSYPVVPEKFQDFAGPAPCGSTASTPAAMARAGIRLWAASSSEVWPYPGSPTTRGSRW